MKCGYNGMDLMLFFKFFTFAWMIVIPFLFLARFDKLIKTLEKKDK